MLKIIKKATEKAFDARVKNAQPNVECTLYGFVYDNSKTFVQRVSNKQMLR